MGIKEEGDIMLRITRKDKKRFDKIRKARRRSVKGQFSFLLDLHEDQERRNADHLREVGLL